VKRGFRIAVIRIAAGGAAAAADRARRPAGRHPGRLPTNLSRVSDRNAAVLRARELRLLSAARTP